MQTRNDGKHVILPAAAPIDRRPDRARLPVTMPRQSDGKLHRDGSGAATAQLKHPVAECGRVHGASELQANERKRIAEYRFVYYRIQKEKRRWTQSLAKHDRLRGRDKRASPNSHKPLTWLGFWRAGRSGRVPLFLIYVTFSTLFPALCRDCLPLRACS